MPLVTTRRDVLGLIPSGAALGLFSPPAWAALSMPKRAIPNTGELLPIIGLGSTRPVAAIAENGTDGITSILRTLVEHGGKVVDTWPRSDPNDAAFGHVINEPELRGRLFVTINLEQVGKQAGIDYFERTLALYGLESIDLLNVGSLIDLDAQWPSLKSLKDAGKARYIGVTAAQSRLYDQLESFLGRESPDFVEINYSITERESEQRFLPMLADRGIAALISRPFMNGAYFARLENQPLPAWTADFECRSWAQFSLQYILANENITCVLTETTNPAHMAENALTASSPIPDAASRRRMRALIDAL